MNDPFNISFEKTGFRFTETFDGRNLGFIRWGMVQGSDGQPKQVAFFVSLVDSHFMHAVGKDMMREADVVAKSQVADGTKYQAYEWLNSEFVSVNPDRQSWFSFA